MPLLYEEDYQILNECGMKFEEDATGRLLVIKNFPLPPGWYVHKGQVLEQVEVLWVVPGNYNTSGGDMFWVFPALKRADGKTIPSVSDFGGGDPRHFMGKEYCRWSRHFKPASWRPKIDNIQKVLDRTEWALRNPDANK